MPLILPNTITNNIPADGDKLGQNFNTITDWANQEAVTRDGSTAMVSPLLLPGPPTQPNQAATKGYVDTTIDAWKPKWGSVTLNLNQDGRSYLTHNLGKIPSSVQLTVYNGGGSPAITAIVQQLTDINTIAVQCLGTTGQPTPGVSVIVFWLVFP